MATRGSLLLTALGLTGALVAASACGPHRQPPPDPSIMKETEWPQCITTSMSERIDHCPALVPLASADPAPCTVSPPPPERAALAPSHVPPADVVAAHPALQQALLALEAATDQGLDGAQRAYTRALRNTPKGSVARAWAHLGAREIAVRRGDLLAARDESLDARRVALTTHDEALLAVTREALVTSFAATGQPSAAADGLDPWRGEEALAPLLSDLAAELVATGRHDGAATVTQTLRQLDPGRSCLHQATLAELSASATDANAREATAAALSELVADVQAIPITAGQGHACHQRTARILVELAERWRVQALGDATSARAEPHAPLDAVSLDYAAQAHAAVLGLFDQAKLEALGVCADRRVLAHHHAELLFAQNNWQECGNAFELALRADPRGARGEHAALAAVTCRQRAWLEGAAELAVASEENRMAAVLERTDDWRMMLRAFKRYMCVAGGAAAIEDSVSKVAYARAEAFLDGGAVWESAIAFRLLAFSVAHGAASRQAAARYAEQMDELAGSDDVCRNELQLDLERLDAMHCADTGGAKPNSAPAGNTECGRLRTVLDRIKRPIL